MDRSTTNDVRGRRATVRRAAGAAALALLAPALVPGAAQAAEQRSTLAEVVEREGAPTSSARTSNIPLAAAAAAMGSRISGNSTVGSGRSAAAYLCTTQFPNQSKNDVVGTRGNTGGVLELGAVVTNNRSGTVNGRKAVASFAAAADIVLGDGQVRIEGLQSFSQVIRTNNDFRLNSNVTVAALEIAGQRIPVDMGSGTQTIPVPGFGTLTFNDVRRVKKQRKAVVRTAALIARLDDGTRIQLVRSKARLDTVPDGVFRGGAWGSQVEVAGMVGSGRSGFVPMPCSGTDGTANTNNTVNWAVPAVMTADTTSSAVRTRTYRNGNGEGVSFNRLADVELGGGQLSISVVEAFALVVRAPGGRVVRSRPFSAVGSITAGGETYQAPPPGESLEIPGVATLTAGVVEERPRGLTVTALKVELADGSGAEVDLGVATVFARR